MLENHVSFVVPKAVRTGLNQAIRAEARGVAPFRHQQLTFDTADGMCVERGLFLLADANAIAESERVHRVVQLVTASAAREVAWPEGRRQFDLERLQLLLQSTATDFGPPLESAPVLLPRARIVLRGRRGLLRAQGADSTVIEAVSQRCEIRTAMNNLVLYRFGLTLVSGTLDGLFEVARDWQQRFDLTVDPHPHYVQAARLAAGKRRRPRKFGAPVWQEGRQLADTATYPVVGEAGVLAAVIADVLINACAISEGDADEHRLQAFEDAVHSIGCLLEQRRAGTVPASLMAYLQVLLNRRSEASAIKWLERALRDDSSAQAPAIKSLLSAARSSSPASLRSLAVDPKTRAWLLELLGWAGCEDGISGPGHEAPGLAEQSACRQRLETRLSKAQADAELALTEDVSRRARLWHDLSQLDEALTLFGPILPRRLMLRYRMVARAALGPLTDWLTITRAIERAPNHLTDPAASEALLSQWRSEQQAANERVLTQLSRLSQSSNLGSRPGLPAL